MHAFCLHLTFHKENFETTTMFFFCLFLFFTSTFFFNNFKFIELLQQQSAYKYFPELLIFTQKKRSLEKYLKIDSS